MSSPVDNSGGGWLKNVFGIGKPSKTQQQLNAANKEITKIQQSAADTESKLQAQLQAANEKLQALEVNVAAQPGHRRETQAALQNLGGDLSNIADQLKTVTLDEHKARNTVAQMARQLPITEVTDRVNLQLHALKSHLIKLETQISDAANEKNAIPSIISDLKEKITGLEKENERHIGNPGKDYINVDGTWKKESSNGNIIYRQSQAAQNTPAIRQFENKINTLKSKIRDLEQRIQELTDEKEDAVALLASEQKNGDEAIGFVVQQAKDTLAPLMEAAKKNLKKHQSQVRDLHRELDQLTALKKTKKGTPEEAGIVSAIKRAEGELSLAEASLAIANEDVSSLQEEEKALG